jgi:hypothetical protein
MNVILIASIVWDAVRRERVYREIRRNTERIGREDAARPAAQPWRRRAARRPIRFPTPANPPD